MCSKLDVKPTVNFCSQMTVKLGLISQYFVDIVTLASKILF